MKLIYQVTRVFGQTFVSAQLCNLCLFELMPAPAQPQVQALNAGKCERCTVAEGRMDQPAIKPKETAC